jgi:hypothetical protein
VLIVAAALVRVAHEARGARRAVGRSDTRRARQPVDGTGASVEAHGLSAQRQRYDHAYFANGVSKSKETFKLGAANAQGISAITGSGKRISGGTSVHKNEKCSYTFTGS